MMMTKKLVISTINVNSFNLSTTGLKKFKKVEGITGRKPDIILMRDCRVGRNKGELEKMFNMTMNGQYDLCLNSENESRGTGIAAK
jgi:plasmid maintenance system killer protein